VRYLCREVSFTSSESESESLVPHEKGMTHMRNYIQVVYIFDQSMLRTNIPQLLEVKLYTATLV
jgi:hypothetical protein